MMISTGDKSPKILTGENKENKKNYTEFKYTPSDFKVGVYYADFKVGVYHNKEIGIDTYYHLLELDKLVSFVKKEFEPYDKVTYFENSDYGRINHSFIELDFKVYNKKLNTTRHYYINSENEPKINEIIQGLKDYGFVMSEGTVEECYYNYLGINMFGKFIWEKYEKK